MPHPSVPTRKQPPAAVRHARAALARLRREDTALADTLEKILPAYALRVAQHGGDSSTAALLAAARQGHGFIKAAFHSAAPRADLMATYRRIKPAPPRAPAPPDKSWSELLAEVASRHTAATPVALHAYLEAMDAAPMTDARRAGHTFYTANLTRFYDAVARQDSAAASASWLEMLEYSAHIAPRVISFFAALLHHAETAGGTDVAASILVATARRNKNRVPESYLSIFPASAAGEVALNRLMDAGFAVTPAGFSPAHRLSAIYTYGTATLARIAQRRRDNSAFITGLFQHGRGDVITALLDAATGKNSESPLSFDHIPPTQWMVRALGCHDLALFRRLRPAHPRLNSILLEWALLAGAGMPPDIFRAFQAEFPPYADDSSLPRLLSYALIYNTPLLDTLLAALPADRQRAAEIIEACLRHSVHGGGLLQKPASGTLLAFEKLLRLPAFGPQHHASYIRALQRYSPDKSYTQYLPAMAMTPDDRAALMIQQGRDSTFVLKLWAALLNDGPVAQRGLDHALSVSIKTSPRATESMGEERYGLVLQLLAAGASGSGLNNGQQALLGQITAARAGWLKTMRRCPPYGLAGCDPSFFKPRLFDKVCALLKEEKYYGHSMHRYAYAACAVFGNEDRLCRYIEKYAKNNTRQPLHNLLQVITLPPDGLANTDLAHWGDAILRHGPAMAALFRFADRIPSPLRNTAGEWSLTLTRAKVASFTYPRADEHLPLATLCYLNGVDERAFLQALDIVKTTPPHNKNIPDINIDGAAFDMPAARFYRLPQDDIRGLFLGKLTSCCQSIGDAAAACARAGYSDPDSGFYVIETAKGEVIGQCWAWRGTQGELCLDSLETLGERVSTAQWEKIVTLFSAQLKGGKNHDVTALTVGTGGETPDSFAHAFPAQKEFPLAAARPRFAASYGDSHQQYIIWHQARDKAKENNPKKQLKPNT